MLRIARRALAPILLFAAVAPAAAETSAAARGALPVGAFCTAARCRDGGTTAWTAAAFGVNGVSRMRDVAQRAVDLEPGANRFRAVALEILGAALTLLGDFDRARGVLKEWLLL